MPILTTIGNAAAKGFGLGALVSSITQVYKKIVVAVQNNTSQSTTSYNLITCSSFDFASSYQSSPTNSNNNFIVYGGQYQYNTSGTSGQPFLFGDMALVPVGVGTTLPYRQIATKAYSSTPATPFQSWGTCAIVPTTTAGTYYAFGIFTNSSPSYGSMWIATLSGDVYSTWNFNTGLVKGSSNSLATYAVGNSVGWGAYNSSFAYISFDTANSAFTNGTAGCVSTQDSTSTNNSRSFSRADTNWKTPQYINGSCCVDGRWLPSYGYTIGFCLPIVNVANTRTYIVTGVLQKDAGIFNTSQIALYNASYSIGNEEVFQHITNTDLPLKKASYITADTSNNHYVATIVKSSSYIPVICKLNQYANSLTETWEYTSSITDIAITAIDYIPYLDCLYVQFTSVSYLQSHYIAKVIASGASKGTVLWIKKILFGTSVGTSSTYTSGKVSFNQQGNCALIPGAILSDSKREAVIATYSLDGTQDGTAISFDSSNTLTVTAESSSVFALSSTSSSIISSQYFGSFSTGSTFSWSFETITTTNYAGSNTTQTTYTY